MKTITLPIHNRPHYLKQTLDSLRQFDLSEYTLFVNAEPGCPENVALIESIDFMKVDLQINRAKLGVWANPHSAIDRAIEAGSTWNYHIEEDLVFSPDAFDLVEWYYNNQKDDILIYGTCHRYNTTEDKNDVKLLTHSLGFSGLGWCISRDTWITHFRDIWFNVSPKGRGMHDGWDWNVGRYIQNTGFKEITPVLSRSNTVGEFGTYSDSESFQMFIDLNISEMSNVTEYVYDSTEELFDTKTKSKME